MPRSTVPGAFLKVRAEYFREELSGEKSHGAEGTAAIRNQIKFLAYGKQTGAQFSASMGAF